MDRSHVQPIPLCLGKILSLCKTCAWIYFFSVVPQSVIRLILVKADMPTKKEALRCTVQKGKMCEMLSRRRKMCWF